MKNKLVAVLILFLIVSLPFSTANYIPTPTQVSPEEDSNDCFDQGGFKCSEGYSCSGTQNGRDDDACCPKNTDYDFSTQQCMPDCVDSDKDGFGRYPNPRCKWPQIDCDDENFWVYPDQLGRCIPINDPKINSTDPGNWTCNLVDDVCEGGAGDVNVTICNYVSVKNPESQKCQSCGGTLFDTNLCDRKECESLGNCSYQPLLWDIKGFCSIQPGHEYLSVLNCTEVPRCEDGILDGNEEEIDCGGDCKPCNYSIKIQVEDANDNTVVFKQPGDYVTFNIYSKNNQSVDIFYDFGIEPVNPLSEKIQVEGGKKLSLKFKIKESVSLNPYFIAGDSLVSFQIEYFSKQIYITNKDLLFKNINVSEKENALANLFTKASSQQAVIYYVDDYGITYPWKTLEEYKQKSESKAEIEANAKIKNLTEEKCNEKCENIIIIGDDFVVPYFRYNDPENSFLTDSEYAPKTFATIPLGPGDSLSNKKIAIVVPDNAIYDQEEMIKLEKVIYANYGKIECDCSEIRLADTYNIYYDFNGQHYHNVLDFSLPLEFLSSSEFSVQYSYPLVGLEGFDKEIEEIKQQRCQVESNSNAEKCHEKTVIDTVTGTQIRDQEGTIVPITLFSPKPENKFYSGNVETRSYQDISIIKQSEMSLRDFSDYSTILIGNKQNNPLTGIFDPKYPDDDETDYVYIMPNPKGDEDNSAVILVATNKLNLTYSIQALNEIVKSGQYGCVARDGSGLAVIATGTATVGLVARGTPIEFLTDGADIIANCEQMLTESRVCEETTVEKALWCGTSVVFAIVPILGGASLLRRAGAKSELIKKLGDLSPELSELEQVFKKVDSTEGWFAKPNIYYKLNKLLEGAQKGDRTALAAELMKVSKWDNKDIKLLGALDNTDKILDATSYIKKIDGMISDGENIERLADGVDIMKKLKASARIFPSMSEFDDIGDFIKFQKNLGSIKNFEKIANTPVELIQKYEKLIILPSGKEYKSIHVFTENDYIKAAELFEDDKLLNNFKKYKESMNLPDNSIAKIELFPIGHEVETARVTVLEKNNILGLGLDHSTDEIVNNFLPHELGHAKVSSVLGERSSMFKDVEGIKRYAYTLDTNFEEILADRIALKAAERVGGKSDFIGSAKTTFNKDFLKTQTGLLIKDVDSINVGEIAMLKAEAMIYYGDKSTEMTKYVDEAIKTRIGSISSGQDALIKKVQQTSEVLSKNMYNNAGTLADDLADKTLYERSVKEVVDANLALSSDKNYLTYLGKKLSYDLSGLSKSKNDLVIEVFEKTQSADSLKSFGRLIVDETDENAKRMRDLLDINPDITVINKLNDLKSEGKHIKFLDNLDTIKKIEDKTGSIPLDQSIITRGMNYPGIENFAEQIASAKSVDNIDGFKFELLSNEHFINKGDRIIQMTLFSGVKGSEPGKWDIDTLIMRNVDGQWKQMFVDKKSLSYLSANDKKLKTWLAKPEKFDGLLERIEGTFENVKEFRRVPDHNPLLDSTDEIILAWPEEILSREITAGDFKGTKVGDYLRKHILDKNLFKGFTVQVEGVVIP